MSYTQWIAARWRLNPENYVAWATGFKLCPGYMVDQIDRNLIIAGLGLVGEAGEVSEHVKKLFRDGRLDRDALLKELGDVHHYWHVLLLLFGFTQEEVELANKAKLEARDAA